MGPSINCRSAVIVGCSFIVIFTVMSSRGSSPARNTAVDWKSVDLKKEPLPADIDALREKVMISQDTVDVDGTKVFIQTAAPAPGVEESGKNVLLLHGAAFTSQTWIDRVPTIATLSALGHNVVAVDLPGYGKSARTRVRKNGEFLAQFIKSVFGDKKPVVITPSMSGSFFIPMLKSSENRNLVSGWVPVAPVGTSSVPAGFFSGIQIPTMFVYGENDRGLGFRSRDDLADLPDSTKPQVLDDAGHPAYLDQPEVWHTLLYNFINLI